MGFWRSLLEGFDRAAEKHIVEDAFRRGQNGEPPPVYRTPMVREAAEKAYDQGQKSVAAKVVRDLTNK